MRIGWFQKFVNKWPGKKKFVAAMVSMIAGSQIVHIHYQPLADLNNYVKKELQNLPDNIQEKIRKELKEEGILK
ncbi:unnamed protein product, partial [Brenthis ino]